MVDSASTLLAGVVFGIALAAPPGPMNAVIAEESVRRGWVAGFLAGLGAMTADACFFVLAYLGVVGFVERVPTVRALMVGVGGLLMLYFAYGAVRGASSFAAPADSPADPDDGPGGHRGFLKALLLALTNPYQILFWLTVGVGLLRPGTLDVLGALPAVGGRFAGLLVVRTGSPLLVGGLFVGIACWIVGFPGTLRVLGRRVDRFAAAVAAASAAVLVGFGVWFLLDAVRSLVL